MSANSRQAVDVAIMGAAGRMGQTLLRTAQALEGVRITAAVEVAGHAALGADAGAQAGLPPLGVPITTAAEAAAAHVMIDFTLPDAVPDHLRLACQARQGYVLGTTGLDRAQREAVLQAATQIPVVWAPNMSLGVNLLFDLVRRAAAILDPSYDIEVVEMHHRHKRDAPSGTALGLAEAACAGRGATLAASDLNYGRQGLTGPRPRGQVAIHTLRGGDVVGDHTVIFAADGERVELTHKAGSREAFAKGALNAALWLHGRPPGLYNMRHVLGLE